MKVTIQAESIEVRDSFGPMGRCREADVEFGAREWDAFTEGIADWADLSKLSDERIREECADRGIAVYETETEAMEDLLTGLSKDVMQGLRDSKLLHDVMAYITEEELRMIALSKGFVID